MELAMGEGESGGRRKTTVQLISSHALSLRGWRALTHPFISILARLPLARFARCVNHDAGTRLLSPSLSSINHSATSFTHSATCTYFHSLLSTASTAVTQCHISHLTRYVIFWGLNYARPAVTCIMDQDCAYPPIRFESIGARPLYWLDGLSGCKSK